MSMKKSVIFALITVFWSVAGIGQTKQEQARSKGTEAIRLMDKKDYEGAIGLLNQCVKLQPKTHVYYYELGLAYHLSGDTKKGIEYAKKALSADDANDQCYQLYGNLLDMSGQREKALEAYESGLKMFPGSGRLYLEKGNSSFMDKKYGDALTAYENGIEADPSFSSNYYRAAQLYCSSEEEVWGMIYGEIFINMEPTSERSQETSRMLYKTYESEIVLGDSVSSVSFSRSAIVLNEKTDPADFKLPFPLMVYEPNLMLSIIGETKISLASLNAIRTRFLENYLRTSAADYPNMLFDYQKKVRDAGHLEAYNYWLLRSGNPSEFNTWLETHEEAFKAFAGWFNENRLVPDAGNRFYRGQY